MFELFAVHTERLSSQQLLMRALDRVHRNVASNVRSPILQKRRAPIVLFPLSRKYNYIAVENTGFVSLIQRHITISVPDDRIQKLSVSRNICGSVFAN